jgi:hypothetical protein
MTRTINTTPRVTPRSMARSRSSSGKPPTTDIVDVKQRKGQNWALRLFNSKNDLDLDFSLKEGTAARIDEVEAVVEAEAVPERTSRSQPDANEPRPQAQLADVLVLPRKPRKGTGMHIFDVGLRAIPYQPLDGDFEVVPPIRSVIVLEDNATPDLDADEPWEHVSMADERPIHSLSYAKVASLNP